MKNAGEYGYEFKPVAYGSTGTGCRSFTDCNISPLTILDHQAKSRALRYGPVAAELVERYASLAPDPIKDESVLRIVSWLGDNMSGKSIKAGPLDISFPRRFRG